MPSLYPILPLINHEALDSLIIPTTTIINYPTNFKSKSLRHASQERPLYVTLYCHDGASWFLKRTEEIPFGNASSFRRPLTCGKDDQCILICSYQSPRVEKISALPAPTTLRIDNARVDERASINLSYRQTTVSYQGEYPYTMALSKKSTFFSSSILASTHQGYKNFLILLNISVFSEPALPSHITYFSISDPDKHYKLSTRTNACTVIDLGTLDVSLDQPILFFSKTNSYLPLFLSVCLETGLMSFEHTHPPSEFFWGFHKYPLTNYLKKLWSA